MSPALKSIRELCAKQNISIILPAADHPGMHRVYTAGKAVGELLPAVTPIDAEISIAPKSKGATRSVTFEKART